LAVAGLAPVPKSHAQLVALVEVSVKVTSPPANVLVVSAVKLAVTANVAVMVGVWVYVSTAPLRRIRKFSTSPMTRSAALSWMEYSSSV
jgi:hypothetical protein